MLVVCSGGPRIFRRRQKSSGANRQCPVRIAGYAVQSVCNSGTYSHSGEFTDTRKVRASVVDAINDLPQEFREAVQLRDLDGLSYDEIAKIIDCPVGTVKSRVNRGRLRLQKRLHHLADEFIGGLTPAASVRPN